MRKTIFILLLWLPFIATAQLFNFSFKTSNQQFVEDAVRGSIVCIEQKYALSDTVSGDEFGRNGLDYFNYVDFIGVETDKGLLLYSEVLTPWEKDKDFAQYKGKYKPVLKASELVKLNGANNGPTTLPENFVSSLEDLKGLALSRDYSLAIGEGLQTDTVAGTKEGWAIWIIRRSNSEKIDSVSYTCIRQQIEIPADGSCINATLPDVDNEVLGGIYVTPKVTAPGQLTFYINGVFACIDDNWKLLFPFVTEQTETPEKTETSRLTPIKAPNQLPRKHKIGRK